ncbi:hypothetical protein NDU88_001182 [Pleurodeles waltl]|uniref:Uncharacterized protein n=1 Tax=Pleurodeles waltl TaxID=8319 RepID=A0AAV7P350_PLEWA|nr:hypothetical protein NDU88_001182 [Pleurodeles waltl]
MSVFIASRAPTLISLHYSGTRLGARRLRDGVLRRQIGLFYFWLAREAPRWTEEGRNHRQGEEATRNRREGEGETRHARRRAAGAGGNLEEGGEQEEDGYTARQKREEPKPTRREGSERKSQPRPRRDVALAEYYYTKLPGTGNVLLQGYIISRYTAAIKALISHGKYNQDTLLALLILL